jgi:hypothetical protein
MLPSHFIPRRVSRSATEGGGRFITTGDTSTPNSVSVSVDPRYTVSTVVTSLTIYTCCCRDDLIAVSQASNQNCVHYLANECCITVWIFGNKETTLLLQIGVCKSMYCAGHLSWRLTEWRLWRREGVSMTCAHDLRSSTVRYFSVVRAVWAVSACSKRPRQFRFSAKQPAILIYVISSLSQFVYANHWIVSFNMIRQPPVKSLPTLHS